RRARHSRTRVPGRSRQRGQADTQQARIADLEPFATGDAGGMHMMEPGVRLHPTIPPTLDAFPARESLRLKCSMRYQSLQERLQVIIFALSLGDDLFHHFTVRCPDWAA